MKCIQAKYENLPGGKKSDMTIRRLEDAAAHFLVTGGDFKFVPKSLWKIQEREPAEISKSMVLR